MAIGVNYSSEYLDTVDLINNTPLTRGDIKIFRSRGLSFSEIRYLAQLYLQAVS